MLIDRRVFLRGFGGAAIAAPFLGSTVDGQAQAGDAPRRLIVMFTHYGCITNRWFPETSHGALGAQDYVGTTLEPLAPHAAKLLLPRGVRAMNEWTPDLSLGQGNDFHTQVVGTYFTCVPISPHSDDPFGFEAATKLNAMPTAPSLDHVCAQQLHADGLPLLLNVGRTGDAPPTAISYSAGGTRYDGIRSPVEAFGKITGLFQDAAPSPDDYRVVRGQSVVDLVRDDLRTLERLDMSASDRRKLEAWKELLTETTHAVRVAQCSAEMAEQLGLTDASLMGAPSMDRVAGKVLGDLDSADIFSNVAVLATLCDLSRVTFLKYPANHAYAALGITQDTDSLSHRTNGGSLTGPCLADVVEKLHTIDRFHASKFAHLVTQLDAIDEGEERLLDSCAVVWFQESSDGSAGNLNNMPIIQAGGCGGYFKTGVAVNLFDGSADLHRGNSEDPCNVDGEITAIKITGTPPEIANAPINKYYCNLMNAIGVKADAEGFPAAGGADVVSRFGMYDRTEDFASGGELPPMIYDPGEFEDLRA